MVGPGVAMEKEAKASCERPEGMLDRGEPSSRATPSARNEEGVLGVEGEHGRDGAELLEPAHVVAEEEVA